MDAILFLCQGSAAYVMASYNNSPYILIEEGDHFGDIDIVLANEMQRLDLIESESSSSDDIPPIFAYDLGHLRREFTVVAQK